MSATYDDLLDALVSFTDNVDYSEEPEDEHDEFVREQIVDQLCEIVQGLARNRNEYSDEQFYTLMLDLKKTLG